MMKWIYILKCEDGYYYVGETTRLYRRFWEHLGGRGGLNTQTHKPETIVAIYKAGVICKFFDYDQNVSNATELREDYYDIRLLYSINNDDTYDDCDQLYAENTITECMMINMKDNWTKIRGGKYTRMIDYKFPSYSQAQNLPICTCGLPCDLRLKETDNRIYFRCAKKNMWDYMKDMFEIDEDPCNYYSEYTRDQKLRSRETKRREERTETLKDLFSKARWLENVKCVADDNNCVGGCGKTRYQKISYADADRNLCFDCFIQKFAELSAKYGIKGKCLL